MAKKKPTPAVRLKPAEIEQTANHSVVPVAPEL